MPELPEVETLRRSLERHVSGDTITRVEVRSPALREPIPRAALARCIAGQRITGLRRRAKYLLIDVEGDSTLVIHLGMSGRLLLEDPRAPAVAHEHLRFDLSSGRQLRFRDPRRFGLVAVVATATLDDDRRFRHLGPEPLSEEFTAEYLKERARGRRTSVKAFLMDARVVVGVGNIYACEALHRAGVHPSRGVNRISVARWRGIAAAITVVLEEAIAQGGTTLNDFVDAVGDPGYFRVHLLAYGREGEACFGCGRPIRRRVQAGRSTFYCPGCQR